MALQDQIIQRLRDRGVTVVDLRNRLPRNGTWMHRPVSAIKQVAGHWDAEHRPHGYDSEARYVQQANYHINKDWAPPGNVHGDGLMYAWKIDNTGWVFVTRDLEDVLWSVGDQNYVTASYCFDGTTGDGATREQIATEQQLLEVLCYHTPEIPAGQANALGHQEVPGNQTSCPGEFLASIRSYRAERDTHPEKYDYDYPPVTATPAPAPAQPAPQPAPAPVTPPPAPVVTPPVIAPPAPSPQPTAPAPGTIIQPEPGKGGGVPTGQTNADTIPVSTPPVATPTPNPTPIPNKPMSFAEPRPVYALPTDTWDPFVEGEKIAILEGDGVAHSFIEPRLLLKTLAAGAPVLAVGYLTRDGHRYLVGKSGYGVEVEPAPQPAAPVAPTLAEATSVVGELIRAITRFWRRITGQSNKA